MKSIETTLRKNLVETIIDLAGDEYETRESIIELAKESDEQLIERLIQIANNLATDLGI